jgi:hypothetical protein
VLSFRRGIVGEAVAWFGKRAKVAV